MKKTMFLCLAAASLCLAACGGTGKDGGSTSGDAAFHLVGDIADAGGMQVFFDAIDLSNTSDIIRRVDADAQGHFDIALEERPEAGVYRLRIGAKRAMLLLNGSEKEVGISGDLAGFDGGGLEITGSSATESYWSAASGFQPAIMTPEQITAFLDGQKPEVAALLAFSQLKKMDGKSLAILKGVQGRLEASDPTSGITKSFGNYVKDKISNFKGLVIPAEIRKAAQEINLPSPQGKKYALSELKGKVVLVDFWASWCRPCRMANPHVVSMYEKYNKDGFEVFSVSLDSENAKNRWVDAIKQDKLRWPYHVSDLKKWSSAPARAWGVSGIPRTFLLDKEGRIAAINPKGKNLEMAIQELL